MRVKPPTAGTFGSVSSPRILGGGVTKVGFDSKCSTMSVPPDVSNQIKDFIQIVNNLNVSFKIDF